MSNNTNKFLIPKVIIVTLTAETMPTAIPTGSVMPMGTNKQKESVESSDITNESVITDVVKVQAFENAEVKQNSPKKDCATLGSSIGNNLTIPAEISTIASLTIIQKETPSILSVTSPTTKSRTAISSPTTRSQTISSFRKRTTPDKYVPSVVSTVQRKIDLTNSRKKSKSSIFASEKKDQSCTEVEILDDDSKVECNSDDPVIDTEIIKELERDYILKKSLADLQPDDTDITDASDISERKFFNCLFKMKIRNGSRISWAGYLLGYCREIHLTEYAKQYMKTRKYNFLNHSICKSSKYIF
jgi:hypothetical protein